MPQPRPDDPKVIALPPDRLRVRAERFDDGERGRILLFTGVRCERFVDEAAFAAALAGWAALAEERALP